MILDIYSNDNGIIKELKQLMKRKYREKLGKYMVEGVRIVEDAIKNDKEIDYLLICDELYKTSGGEGLLEVLLQRQYKIYRIPNRLFMELSDTQNPQGIMAVIPWEVYVLDDVLKKGSNTLVVLDRIQDPGNLGTIIRSADAAGIDGVILSKGCVDLFNLKTIRSTMGSIFHLPIINMGTTMEIVEYLKARNIKIATTSLDTDQYYYDINFTHDIAMVIGNEANGVSKDVIEASDYIVKIPMIGKAESLNASVAASIIIYEGVRQRHNQKI